MFSLPRRGGTAQIDARGLSCREVEARIRALTSAGFCSLCACGHGGSEGTLMRDKALALRSIEPVDADFSDLESLYSVLFTKYIGGLGEASHHGNAAAFQAKRPPQGDAVPTGTGVRRRPLSRPDGGQRAAGSGAGSWLHGSAKATGADQQARQHCLAKGRSPNFRHGEERTHATIVKNRPGFPTRWENRST